MRVIAVANQKGGVGKTTTSMNLAASLRRLKKRVLMIDLDPQGNASVGLGIDIQDLETSICEVLLDRISPLEVCRTTTSGVDVIPANADLTSIDMQLLSQQDRNSRLHEALKLLDGYHYVILDCPPALNLLTINALIAATGVLIPMQCEYFALEGLSNLIRTLDVVRLRGNSNLALEGLLRCMYDSRNTLTKDVSRQLFQYFPQHVYRTVIPRNVRLAEAPSHGLSVLEYAPKCPGTTAYLALANEIIHRHLDRNESANVVSAGFV